MFTRDMERETAMSNFLPKKNTPQKLNIFAPLVDGPSLFLEKKVSLFRRFFDRTQELTIGREGEGVGWTLVLTLSRIGTLVFFIVSQFFALSIFDGVLLAQSDSSVDRIAPRIFWHTSVFLWFLTLKGFSSYCYFRLSHRSFQLSWN